MVKPFFASTLDRIQEVWLVPSKEIVSRCYTLEQLQFFSSEKIIFFSNFFRRIVPFRRSTQLTDLAGLGPTHVVASRSRHTLSTGQSQSLPRRIRFPTVAMSVFCPRSCLSETATAPDPELQLCSIRMHLAANSVHAFVPPVGPT